MKGNKGITLIALVITIIVLLILAGVSIAMLSGDNSILNNASKSADYNKIGEVRDNIGIRINQNMAEFLDKKYNNATPGNESVVPSDITGKEGKDIVDLVLTAFTGTGKYAPSGCTVSYAAKSGSTTEKEVTITSNKYKVVGTVTISTGAIDWGNIEPVS